MAGHKRLFRTRIKTIDKDAVNENGLVFIDKRVKLPHTIPIVQFNKHTNMHTVKLTKPKKILIFRTYKRHQTEYGRAN